ncbi:TonB-dependent siderophore receptor [Pseudomonas sp. S 311-6]|uniref:TonB-dependent siderophore receptor n=1 Tax=Pseudomonas TaxID=286 RepID=UPI00209681AE|nr:MULTISPECIES: TonB-dependent siderophore receptor [Pseudomonas]MCO7564137.1 TonB-dependent siderophore receptor [Pseudomonas mosselii]MCO7618500.1 TonB-dependent siderophore receptor [Pseudomonas guariconensis]MCO7642678.1 TonB-dependent siderophore receptor [Pseudomonas sp. S 311-6]
MPPRHPFLLAPLCLALACCLPVGVACAQPQADSRQQTWTFDLPAASLATTLDQVARQSGRTIVYAPERVRGFFAPAIQGHMTTEQAIAGALSGTGLVLQVTPGGILTLDRQRTDQVNLGEVMIDATAAEQAWGPVSGYVATRSATGTKSDSALLEVPQTVNVVTRDQMQAQGAQNVTEAVRYTPGVVASFGDSDSRNDVLQSRGFFLRYNLNGSRLPYGAYSAAMMRIEPYGLERIEVLKGPASVLYGQNTPGGLANLVSKRPTFSPVHEIQLQAGSNDRTQGAFDFGDGLDDDGTLAYRLTGLLRDSQGEVDHGYDKREFIAPALTWQPSEDTRLTLLSHYQKDRSISDYVALPADASLHAGANGRLPRNRYLGEPGFDGYEREQFSLGYLLEHRLNDVWSLQQNLQVNRVQIDNSASPGYLLSADGRELSRVATRGEGQARSVTVDTFAQADFTTGRLGHRFLAGVDYLSLTDEYQFASGLYTTPLDIYAPRYGQAVPELIPRIDYHQQREQTGLYLQDQIRLDNWLLTLGARQDWVWTRTESGLAGENRSKQREDKPTGRIGLAYLFDNGLAPYLSYSTSFEPLDGTDFSGRPFTPMTGEQYEVGVKYQPPGSNAFVTLSAFELTQENITTPDPDPTHAGFNVQTGKARVRGLELDAKASLHERLDLLASYAYMDSRVTKANTAADGSSLKGNELVQVPAHQASLWLDHTLGDGLLQGAGIGFGARYMSKAYGDAANTLEMPGRTLFDASLHYDLGKADGRLDGADLRLSANNLFDKRYVAFCQNALQCYYGQRRTLLATLTYRW